jgi:hypothetical protein
MHEAGAVRRAIAHRLEELGEVPVPGRFRMVIRDPLRADPDSVLLFATEYLRDRGVERPEVTVQVLAVPCPTCGDTVRSHHMEPACASCGMPFRPLEGPAIVAQEA